MSNLVKIKKSLDQGKWVLIIAIFLVLVTPYLLTSHSLFSGLDFTNTGQIGDTIGGITAPFVNLLGSILVFLALKAQIEANQLIQVQIDRETTTKEVEVETENLNYLYNHLNESINNFKYSSLWPNQLLEEIDVPVPPTYSGGEAFYAIFQELLCRNHFPEELLLNNTSMSELYSILTILDNLLNRLMSTNSANREIMSTLVQHLFEYRITTRIRSLSIDQIDRNFCDECKHEHGIPANTLELIKRIRTKISGLQSPS